VLEQWGATMNMMTMGGLAIAIGEVVDDAILPFLGGEFLPDFNEGNLIIVTRAMPGTPLSESLRVGGLIQQDLKEIPEVAVVAQFSGRAELYEETEGPDFSEYLIRLKENGRDIEDVMADIRKSLEKYPGFQFDVKQHIPEQIKDILSGSLATSAIQIYGEDTEKLDSLSRAVMAETAKVKGVAGLARERGFNVPRVQVRFNRERLAQYGVTTDTLQTALFGRKISTILEGQRQFDLWVRYREEAVNDPESIRRTLVDTHDGEKVPLGSLAEVSVVNGVSSINHLNALRYTTVECNVAGRDLNSVVNDIRKRIAKAVVLPHGYSIQYGGQYAEQKTARRQIFLLGAVALAGIVMLLTHTGICYARKGKRRAGRSSSAGQWSESRRFS
jgi:Cu/Ag efflux pump CusA